MCKNMTPLVVYVAGNIGSGKSTLLPNLQKKLEDAGCAVQCVPEPVESWKPVLDLLYTDPKKWSFLMQVTVAGHFARTEHRIKQDTSDTDVWIVERSIDETRNVFQKTLEEDGTITPLESKALTNVYDVVDIMQEGLDYHYLYLATPPQACLGRIAARNRSGEDSIDPAYIEHLHSKYTTWFEGVPALRGDAVGKDPAVEPEKVAEEAAEILLLLKTRRQNNNV